MEPSAQLVSVQIGPVVTYPTPAPGEGEWRSGIVKHLVEGPIYLDRLGLAGDAQADIKNHGGRDQAANVYPSEHYQFWRQALGLESMTGGSFGENLTTQGTPGKQRLPWGCLPNWPGSRVDHPAAPTLL